MATKLTVELAREALRVGGTIFLKHRSSDKVFTLDKEAKVFLQVYNRVITPEEMWNARTLEERLKDGTPDLAAFHMTSSEVGMIIVDEAFLHEFDYIQNVHNVPLRG